MIKIILDIYFGVVVDRIEIVERFWLSLLFFCMFVKILIISVEGIISIMIYYIRYFVLVSCVFKMLEIGVLVMVDYF